MAVRLNVTCPRKTNEFLKSRCLDVKENSPSKLDQQGHFYTNKADVQNTKGHSSQLELRFIFLIPLGKLASEHPQALIDQGAQAVIMTDLLPLSTLLSSFSSGFSPLAGKDGPIILRLGHKLSS